MPVRRVQIGPSPAVHEGTCTTCSQMPGFQSRILALVVHLRLPHLHARSTWNDPEASLASRLPLLRCVIFKPLHPPALLTQRRRLRPKNAPQAAEVCFLRLLHVLDERESEWRAGKRPRQSQRLTWEERLSVERKWANAFRENRSSFVPSATKRIPGLPR